MSWIDDAVAAHPHTTWGDQLVVAKDLYGEQVKVAFAKSGVTTERAYWTCWVFRESSYVYRLNQEHMDWARDLIAQALEVDKSKVVLGFNANEFDVRPF